MEPTRPNLFRFAARELHQDAVVAWLLDWARTVHRDADPERNRVGRLFGRHLLGRHETTASAELANVLDVRRQWQSIDVLVRFALVDGRNVVAVIENKTFTTRHSGQLRRYRERATKKFPRHAFAGFYVKTGWLQPTDETLPDGYELVDRRSLLGVLREAESRDPIVQEYLEHLEGVDARYARELVALDDPATASDALRSAHVQWQLLERLFEGIQGKLGNGTNRGGTPWTQFAFRRVYLDREPERWEDLFWRADHRKRGADRTAYVALRSYERFDPTDKARRAAKLARLAVYRAAFERAVQSARAEGMSLNVGRPVTDNRGNFESEVGLFWVGPENLVEALAEWVPVVHRSFIAELTAAEAQGRSPRSGPLPVPTPPRKP